MIGRSMETWPDDALRRVLDARLEQWNPMWYSGPCRCLVGHVLDIQVTDSLAVARRFDTLYPEVEDRFLGLNGRFTLPRTVHAIQARARRILASREQAIEDVIAAPTSRLVVLTESDEPTEAVAR